jgi:tetrahydromethanopterin S-methyltransferase subunit A
MSPAHTVDDWPIAPGDWEVGSMDSPTAIAIVGRGVVHLPSELYSLKGTVKTENIGIEKIIVNIISNSRIRFLVVCGKDEFGHYPGDALLNVGKNGVDEHMRIKGSRSAIPYLCNIPREAVDRLLAQVEIIDLLHPKNVDEIVAYDPAYKFDEERSEELIGAMRKCLERDPGRFDGDPIIVNTGAIMGEGGMIGKELNKASDRFASQMLRMPSQRLSTSASLVVVSDTFSIILDPIESEIVEVPSVELAMRIKTYLSGG